MLGERTRLPCSPLSMAVRGLGQYGGLAGRKRFFGVGHLSLPLDGETLGEKKFRLGRLAR